MKVYVLWHVYERRDDFGEHDEEKLIGIYSTEEKARDAIQSHKDLEGFKDLPVEMNPFDARTMEPNYWLSCMLIDKDAMCRQSRTDYEATYEREPGKSCPTEILDAIINLNAEGRPIWKPMHMQPIFEACDFVAAEEDRDVGADIFERGLCLPSDNKMTPEQQEIIIEAVKSCFN